MTITRKSLADTIDGYDDEIAALQESKGETFRSYREDLAERGIDKDGVKAEVEAVKKAIKRRRLVAEKSAEAVENADALVDEIFAEISPSHAPRATRTRETQESHLADPSDSTSDGEASTSLAGMEGDEDRQQIHESPSINDKASSTAAPQGEAVQSQGTGAETLAGREGRSEGQAASADLPTNSSQEVRPGKSEAEQSASAPVLRQDNKVLRPFCLRPHSGCGGQGKSHCFSCRKAALAEGKEAA